jgi:hypothetical protein
MSNFITIAMLAATGIALVGCKSTPLRTQAVSEQRDNEMLGGIEALEGTWTMIDDPKSEIATVYKTTAAGSAVQEVMFPGMPHEMVNLYHMDGPNLVVTHYCAAGNQPTMVARSVSTDADGAQVYRFDFKSVANYRPDQGHYMGNLTLRHKGDRLTQTWVSLDDNGHETEPMVFEMTRK